MIRNIFKTLFYVASRLLKETPLRKIKWLGHLHNKLYGILSTSNQVQMGDFIIFVDPRDKIIAKKLELYGVYEEFIGETLKKLARPGSTVIDVGANIGLHAIPIAKHIGKSGCVHAFEPDPENYNILMQNIKQNDIHNIITHNCGLSDKEGTALLYQSNVNRGGLSMCRANVDESSNELSPSEISLKVADDYLGSKITNVSLIKIDTEGAEPLVIKGMKKILHDNPNVNILFEFSPRYIENFGFKAEEFLSGLENMQLQLAIIDEGRCVIQQANSAGIVKTGRDTDSALNLIASRDLVSLKSLNINVETLSA